MESRVRDNIYTETNSIEIEGKKYFATSSAISLISCPAIIALDQENAYSQNLMRQADLINSLHHPDIPITYMVRYIFNPINHITQSRYISAGILITAIDKRQKSAQRLNLDAFNHLLNQLSGLFSDYHWQIIDNKSDFEKLYKPIDFNTSHHAEITHRDEFIQLDQILSSNQVGFLTVNTGKDTIRKGKPVYYTHPFIPRPFVFERLLKTLMLLPQRTIFSVLLKPIRLSSEEQEAFQTEIAKCEGFVPNQDIGFRRIFEQRAELLCQGLLGQLFKWQDAPFLMRFFLSSDVQISKSLAESVGVAISSPVGISPFKDTEIELLQKGGYDSIIEYSSKNKKKIGMILNYAFISDSGIGEDPWILNRIKYIFDGLEAACAFRFPIETGDGLSGIKVHRNQLKSLPLEINQLALEENIEKTMIGVNNSLGFSQPIFLKDADRRTHTYVVGQTGTGKTTLLKSMILSDMENGKCVALIDPHGDLYDELLTLIPESREHDVVLFNPDDIKYPVGFNLLECDTLDQRHFVAREMKAIMRRLMEDQYQRAASEMTGPIFYQHMQMNLLLSMSDPNIPGTLLQFYEIFQHSDYWKRWIPLKWKDEMLEQWVTKVLPNMNYLARRDSTATMGEYVSSKFVDFVFDPILRYIFGQPSSTINLKEIINTDKILLVNLAKGRMGESNSQFLGMILMAKIGAEILERAKMPASDRKQFHLYIDEFQSLATENFSVLLSEARKYGLNLVLANQFISQIQDERIMQAVFGNAGTMISFRVGVDDAEKIASHFSPVFNRNDLTNLPNWQACIKTTVDGQLVTPFSMQTTLPTAKPNNAHAKRIIKNSRSAYARSKKEAEKLIKESYKFDKEKQKKEPGLDFSSLFQ